MFCASNGVLNSSASVYTKGDPTVVTNIQEPMHIITRFISKNVCVMRILNDILTFLLNFPFSIFFALHYHFCSLFGIICHLTNKRTNLYILRDL